LRGIEIGRSVVIRPPHRAVSTDARHSTGDSEGAPILYFSKTVFVLSDSLGLPGRFVVLSEIH
jgi:hypothetical protein